MESKQPYELMRACRTRDERVGLAIEMVDAIMSALDSVWAKPESTTAHLLAVSAMDTCRALRSMLQLLHGQDGGTDGSESGI